MWEWVLFVIHSIWKVIGSELCKHNLDNRWLKVQFNLFLHTTLKTLKAKTPISVEMKEHLLNKLEIIMARREIVCFGQFFQKLSVSKSSKSVFIRERINFWHGKLYTCNLSLIILCRFYPYGDIICWRLCRDFWKDCRKHKWICYDILIVKRLL